MAHQWFRVGLDVEIASPIRSLDGVFFPGKVVAPSFDDANKFLVEYENLTTEEDGTSQPFSEDVSMSLLRPRPPMETKLGFKFNDFVDAFFNGGWWKGVVAKALNKSCYLVYLKGMKQSYQFRVSELRVHREWIKGAWFPPYEEEMKQEEDDMNVEVCNYCLMFVFFRFLFDKLRFHSFISFVYFFHVHE